MHSKVILISWLTRKQKQITLFYKSSKDVTGLQPLCVKSENYTF